jgi:hypothetical protein
MTDHSETSVAGTTSVKATSLYVYGIIPAANAGDWPSVAGVGGPVASVWALEVGELAALVSALPPDRTPGRREDLNAHREVLSLAVERGTVIPLRFGMVMEGEDVVRERLLGRHRPKLIELLRTLDGHVQMAVRALYAEGALLRGASRATPRSHASPRWSRGVRRSSPGPSGSRSVSGWRRRSTRAARRTSRCCWTS